MAGIGEASAILGVAQLGLQLAQTLVKVIGDYRDAAVNINRLRDEIHLTSLCLSQLGGLAQENRLIAGRGVLEATNLRERCRAVIWEIRTVIKKGDKPLHPEEITKDDVDVSYFMAWKWALWTKKHLEEPRQELDRLKDSITLTFVTHLALQANDDRERSAYVSQIPGIRRNVSWAEEKYRQTSQPELVEDQIPQQALEASPEEWQEFVEYKKRREESTLIEGFQNTNFDLDVFRTRLTAAGVPNDQIAIVLTGLGAPLQPSKESESNNVKYQAWSLDPFVGRVRVPMTDSELQTEINKNPKASSKLWEIHSKLQPWYKRQIEELVQELNEDVEFEWTLLSLKVVRRHNFFRLRENPPSLQVVVRSNETNLPITGRHAIFKIAPSAASEEVAPLPTVRYNETVSYSQPTAITFGEPREDSETDEQLIHDQLALYNVERPA